MLNWWNFFGVKKHMMKCPYISISTRNGVRKDFDVILRTDGEIFISFNRLAQILELDIYDNKLNSNFKNNFRYAKRKGLVTEDMYTRYDVSNFINAHVNNPNVILLNFSYFVTLPFDVFFPKIFVTKLLETKEFNTVDEINNFVIDRLCFYFDETKHSFHNTSIDSGEWDDVIAKSNNSNIDEINNLKQIIKEKDNVINSIKKIFDIFKDGVKKCFC